MGANVQRIINQMGTCEYANLRPDCLLGDKKKKSLALSHISIHCFSLFFLFRFFATLTYNN